jgi:hypothetical protein
MSDITPDLKSRFSHGVITGSLVTVSISREGLNEDFGHRWSRFHWIGAR